MDGLSETTTCHPGRHTSCSDTRTMHENTHADEHRRIPGNTIAVDAGGPPPAKAGFVSRSKPTSPDAVRPQARHESPPIWERVPVRELAPRQKLPPPEPQMSVPKLSVLGMLGIIR